jgi:pyridoxal 5'-phosphate synthase pdxS subunit
VPFVCGCRDLGEAMRRLHEGAAMIRTKGEAGTGNIVEAVRHMRAVMEGIQQVVRANDTEMKELATSFRVPVELVKEVKKLGKLPVVNFAAGGIATPADAALMMQLGAEGVFVGSGIFKSSNPEVRAKAIVKATTHYQDAAIIAEVSKNLGEAMTGLDIKQIPAEELLAKRGW